jgi:thymidylate synthase
MHVFEGKTVDEVWQRAFSVLEEKQGVPTQTSRGGPTRELLHATFSISDPRQRWVVSRDPPLNPAFALAEVVWILNGSNEAAFLNSWNSQLPKYAGIGATYHGAYGYRLRQHLGFDQLDRAYHVLRCNPNSRQVVLQMWDSRVDLPNENGEPAAPDIPCNIVSLLKIRDNQLEWMQIMRSNDLHLGTPYNFIQFTSLQEVLAGWLGIEVGAYVHWSDSLHLYQDNIDSGIGAANVKVEENSDVLALSYEESRRVLSSLYHEILRLASPRLTVDEFHQIVAKTDFPEAYWHLLLVISAEAARKRGWNELAERTKDQCSNAVLKQVLERWWARLGWTLTT